MSAFFGLMAILGILLTTWMVTDDVVENKYDRWFFAAVACTLFNAVAFLALEGIL